jgi:hypothetical protein
MSELQGMFLRL